MSKYGHALCIVKPYLLRSLLLYLCSMSWILHVYTDKADTLVNLGDLQYSIFVYE